jgi:drug/metabolite transporter (DMT)-like permease
MTPFVLALVLLSTAAHAGWNLISRDRSPDREPFLPVLWLTLLFGALPALLAERGDRPVLPLVWPTLIGAGSFQALYFFGLVRGYRSGDFSLVYPVVRAAPVLVLALIDQGRGQSLTPGSALGMGLIVAGCLLLPLESPRHLTWERYRQPATKWMGLGALGVVGYTLFDRHAALALPAGADTALRYAVWQAVATLPPYALLLWLAERERLRISADSLTLRVFLITLLMFGGYGIILWAYQLATHVSYVFAVRQFSIVLGVLAGALILREPAPAWRLALAGTIVAGIVLIAWGG